MLDFIMRLEGGDVSLTSEEVIDGVAEMVKSGMAWKLQGSYGRFAQSMINSGWIDSEGNVLAYPDAEF